MVDKSYIAGQRQVVPAPLHKNKKKGTSPHFDRDIPIRGLLYSVCATTRVAYWSKDHPTWARLFKGCRTYNWFVKP